MKKNRKKMQDGGVAGEGDAKDQLIATLLGKLQGQGAATPGVGSAITAGTDILSGMVDPGQLDTSKIGVANPTGMLNKHVNRTTGAAALSGAGKGAAAGLAIGGPLGAVIGGGLGALASGIGANSAARTEAQEARRAWSESNTALYAKNLARNSYAKGGKVVGPGTGKSDDVKMDVDDGSFVVPAENAEYAVELGRQYLGWDDNEVAARTGGDTGIMASNGEVVFNPSEVEVLQYHGVDLNELAPQSDSPVNEGMGMDEMGAMGGASGMGGMGSMPMDEEESPIPGFAKGGSVEKDPLMIEPQKRETYLPKYNLPTDKLMPMKQANVRKRGLDISRLSDLNISAGEVAGGLQAAYGLGKLATERKMPERATSQMLRNMTSEARQLSEHGYSPKIVNALNQNVNRVWSDFNRSLADKGGSAAETAAQKQEALTKVIDESNKILMADEAEKARKKTEFYTLDTLGSQLGAQEFDVNKLKVEDWFKRQEAFADLLSAGLSNVIGARALKTQHKTLKEIAEAGKMNITLPG